MRRKAVTVVTCLFSLFFLAFVYKLADDISGIQSLILRSPNVIDVTDALETKVLVTGTELPSAGDWVGKDFDDSSWVSLKLPKYLTGEKDFVPGNFVYYRILVPGSELQKLSHLRDELALGLQQVGFSRVEFTLNGKLWRANTPASSQESLIIIPVGNSGDQLVAIKGWLKEGNMGIVHRSRIMLGKGAELNELYGVSYKLQTVFPLIFILSKGSILFLFTMIFLVISVSPFFDKFLIFGLCVVAEDFLVGSFLQKVLTLNQLTYLFTLVNIGAVIFLFLFSTDAAGKRIARGKIIAGSVILTVIGSLIAVDVLHRNFLFGFNGLLKFWNISLMIVLLSMIPSFFKRNKVLAAGLVVALALNMWSTFFSANVGINYKAFGNLILFLTVAYETFLLLRKEQDLLRVQEKQLLEQEKDVAIGKTASLLAHDVRRPLEQMRMVLDRLSSGQATNEFIEIAKRDVDFSLTSVNNQVNDIMNFTRQRNVELTPVSFYRLLSSSLKQVLTINQNVDVKLHYDFQAPVKVMADESRLAGVLTNILSNAIEAIRDIGKRNSGTISCSTKLDGNNFIIFLTNDGPHIPETFLGEIFRPLFTHGKEKGTGLGLASVSRAIQDHKGTIKVSNVTGGVSFTISLTASSEIDAPVMNEFRNDSGSYAYRKLPRAEVSGDALRILVLDDDTQVAGYFRFLSGTAPFQLELTFASSFQEAEKEIATRRFDLYILDYDLGGGKTGADFYQQYLPFLKEEVVIHSNRESALFNGISCQHRQKPMPAEDFHELLSSVNTQRKRVLLVDDSELVREAWTLFHGGHNLRTAVHPEEALMSLETHPLPGFCVLDYYFDNSDLTGLDLAARISERYPEMTILISSNAAVPDSKYRVISKTDFEIRKIV